MPFYSFWLIWLVGCPWTWPESLDIYIYIGWTSWLNDGKQPSRQSWVITVIWFLIHVNPQLSLVSTIGAIISDLTASLDRHMETFGVSIKQGPDSYGRRMADGGWRMWRTADGGRRTADGRDGGRRTADGGWRMAGWRMADGGWRMADGGWRMADGGWRDGGWRMADGGWWMVDADGKVRIEEN